MSEDEASRRIGRLKTVKSAFILEARRLSDEGLPLFALPFFRRAADLELELVDLFRDQGRQNDASVSLLSAGSCLVQARQFRTAVGILRQVVEQFPEAVEMLSECKDKEDHPMAVETPALQVLVNLLVKKGLISDGEWAQALEAI